MFFAAIVFLFFVVVHFSWELSRLEERSRSLAEEVALLRAELELERVDSTRFRRSWVSWRSGALVALVLLVAACGSGDDETVPADAGARSTTTSSTTSTTAPPTTTTSPAPRPSLEALLGVLVVGDLVTHDAAGGIEAALRQPARRRRRWRRWASVSTPTTR